MMLAAMSGVTMVACSMVLLRFAWWRTCVEHVELVRINVLQHVASVDDEWPILRGHR